MTRLFATRFGFFALAALVSAATVFVIEPAMRWVSLGLGGLYLLLAILFVLDEIGDEPDHPAPKP